MLSRKNLYYFVGSSRKQNIEIKIKFGKSTQFLFSIFVFQIKFRPALTGPNRYFAYNFHNFANELKKMQQTNDKFL